MLTLARRIVCPVLARFEPPLMQAASWGWAHRDKTFLVIRRNEPQAGIGSLALSTLGWIRFAERNGFTPVVDMRSLRSMYLKRGERGRVNAWESFFEQPAGFGLDDIAEAAKVIVATGILPVRGFMPGWSSEKGEWRQLASRCLRLAAPPAGAFFCGALQSVDRSRLVGVLARGTDYLQLRPKGHPVQPTAEQLIAKVLETNREAVVYLVTEDAAMNDAFRTAFGDNLIVADQTCVSYAKGFLADNGEVKGNRSRALDYLRALYDLAKCPSVVAGRTSGSLLASLLADPAQRSFHFDLGVYGLI